MMRAYQEIIDLIKVGADAEGSERFRPSEATKQRVIDLLQRQRTSELAADEAAELGQYMQLEQLRCLTRVLTRYHSGDAALQTVAVI